MYSSSLQNALREACQVELDEEAVSFVLNGSLDQLKRLSECLDAQLQVSEVPKKRLFEFRPFLNFDTIEFLRQRSDSNSLAESLSELTSFSADYDTPIEPDWEKIEQAVSLIKHHLLFCHGIGLEDCSDGLLDPFRLGFENRDYRHKLSHYLSFLLRLKPLIDAGVVILVDQDPGGRRFLERCESLKYRASSWPPKLDCSYEELQVPFGVSTPYKKQVYSAQTALGHSIIVGDFFSSNLDVYAPDPLLRTVLENGIKLASNRSSNNRIEAHVLNEILKKFALGVSDQAVLDSVLTVASGKLCDGVDCSEILALRNDDKLEEFRSLAESAVQKIVVHQTDNQDAEIVRQIQRDAAAQAHELVQDLENERLLNRLQENGPKLLLDFAVAGLTPWKWPELAKNLADITISSVLDVLTGNEDQDSNYAYIRHCLFLAEGVDD